MKKLMFVMFIVILGMVMTSNAQQVTVKKDVIDIHFWKHISNINAGDIILHDGDTIIIEPNSFDYPYVKATYKDNVGYICYRNIADENVYNYYDNLTITKEYKIKHQKETEKNNKLRHQHIRIVPGSSTYSDMIAKFGYYKEKDIYEYESGTTIWYYYPNGVIIIITNGIITDYFH